MLLVHSWAPAFGYFNLRYTFPSKNLLLVKDALVFTSRGDDLSQFLSKHIAKRHLVQVQTLENRMLQRAAL